MRLNTMSAVMTFVSRMENDSSTFYGEHAERFPELKVQFQAWTKENKRFEKQVKQTYFGIITDTLESNFAFEGLDTDDYELELNLPDDADLSQVKGKASEIEAAIMAFYQKAAELSDTLMADIPRLFKKIAKKRQERSNILDS